MSNELPDEFRRAVQDLENSRARRAAAHEREKGAWHAATQARRAAERSVATRLVTIAAHVAAAARSHKVPRNVVIVERKYIAPAEPQSNATTRFLRAIDRLRDARDFADREIEEQWKRKRLADEIADATATAVDGGWGILNIPAYHPPDLPGGPEDQPAVSGGPSIAQKLVFLREDGQLAIVVDGYRGRIGYGPPFLVRTDSYRTIDPEQSTSPITAVSSNADPPHRATNHTCWIEECQLLERRLAEFVDEHGLAGGLSS